MTHTFFFKKIQQTIDAEHRLIFEKPATAAENTDISTSTISQTDIADKQSIKADTIAKALEANRTTTDTKKRLDTLRSLIHTNVDTQERIAVVDAIITDDNRQETIALAQEIVHAEMQRMNEKMTAIHETKAEQKSDLIEQTQESLFTLKKDFEAVRTVQQKIYARENERTIAEQQPQSLTTKIGNTFESLTNTLPESVTAKMSRNEKIALSATVTGAGVLVALYGLYRWFNRKKSNNTVSGNESSTPKKSWLQTLVLGGSIALIGAGAFFGFKHFKELKQELQNVKNLAKKGVDTAVNAGKSAVQSVTELVTGEKPWEQYGISEAEYEEAKDMWLENPTDSRLQTILKTNEHLHAFTTEMNTNFAEVHINGIHYSGYERIQKSTEKIMQVTVNSIEEWIEKNYAESALIGLAAYKIGAVKAALMAGGTVMQKGLAVGTALAKFGIKNPLVSLLIAGGTTGTALSVKHQLKNAKGPRDFAELITASKQGAPLLIDGTTQKPLENTTAQALNSAKDSFIALSENAFDAMSIITNGIQELTIDVSNAALNSITTNAESEIVMRNKDGFNGLETALENKELLERSRAHPDQTFLENIARAKEKLETFEIHFFTERTDTVFAATDISQASLLKLQESMLAIQMPLTNKNGILVYQDGTTEKHLCIDPSITNKEEALQKSNDIDLEQGILSRLTDQAIQRIRLEQDTILEGKENITLDNVPAIIRGNTLWIASLDNLTEYTKYQISSLTEFGKYITGNSDTNTLMQTLGNAVGTSVLCNISTTIFTTGKRLLLGGGKPTALPKNALVKWGSRILHNIPGIHGVHTIRDIYNGTGDVIRSLSIANQTQGSIWDARRLNTVLSKAGINARWIDIIEHGDASKLRTLLGRLGDETELSKLLDTGDAADLAQLRIALRDIIHNKMNAVKNGFMWFKRDVLDGEKLYERVATYYKNRPKNSAVVKQVVDTAIDASKKASEVLEPVTDAIKNALRAGKNSEAVKLITDNVDTFIKAAKDSKVAMQFAKIGKWLQKGGGAFVRKLPLIGTVLEGVFAGMTMLEIQSAQAAGNAEKAKTLTMKLQNQGVAFGSFAAGPLALKALGMTGGIGFVAGGSIVAAQMYADAVYDSIATWETSTKEWMQKNPEELVVKLKTIPVGYTDMGHRAAEGHSLGYGAWRWARSFTTAGDTKNKAENETQFTNIENTNKNTRTEILAAYFLQVVKGQVTRLPNETDAQVQEKAMHMVQDRISYVKSITGGSFDINSGGTTVLEEANTYGDLMQMKRELQNTNQSTTIEMPNADGSSTKMDLESLHTNTATMNDVKRITYAPTYEKSTLDNSPSIAIHMFQTYQSELQDMFNEINAMEIDT